MQILRNSFKVLLLSLFLLSCAKEEKSYNKGVNIIPVPNSIEVIGESDFKLTKRSELSASSEHAKVIAEFFAGKMNLSTGYNLEVVDGTDADISLSIDSAMDSKPEGYKLNVKHNKVEVIGKDAAGLFYGMQTFLQLLPAEITSNVVVEDVVWKAPTVVIEDAPRFGYRGIMLDPCRHFVPVEFVKKQLDILAMFKINRMHWHLTEDQAWRIEIKKYPLLTKIGSTRIEGEGYEHSGFYTQEEIKEVVAYAAERMITVIPEFELPGHELAAIAAYPHLSCKGEKISPRIIWGVEDVVMCAGKESTFEFMDDIIEEMATLFPSEYFHIGGDECPKRSWEKCPLCQKVIRDNNLHAKDGHTAEERLQSYIIGRAEEMLAKRGKKLIGWDEILEGGLSETATVMSWQGESGGIAAANMGRNVIMTPMSEGMYINFYQGDYMIEPVSIGGDVPLSKTYSYNPTPVELVENRKDSLVLGVQANLWSEYMYNSSLVEYFAYPRTLAVAEVGWSELNNKDYESFCNRLNNAYVRLDSYDVNYYIPQPEQPYGSTNFVAFVDSVEQEFKTTFPVKMVYTIDGSEPTANSTEYVEPLIFTENTTLMIRSVLPSGKMSPTRVITLEKQNYSAAVVVEGVVNGLKMKSIPGYYLNMKALANSKAKRVKESVIHNFIDLVIHEPFESSLRETKQAANIAEGYLDIKEDGVYHFWSNNNEVWIDNKLLINNDNEVKRHSRKGSSVALAKGLHPIKIVWLGNIIGGWPSNWDNGDITYRKEGEEFRVVDAGDLYYR